MSLFAGENPNLGTTTAISGDIVYPYRHIDASLVSTLPATAANLGNIFIADRAYQFVSAQESHTVAGSDGGAVSLDIEKLAGTAALDAGVVMNASTINLKGTANTVQTLAPSATFANTQLAKGDRIALKDTGVLTAVAGLSVSIIL